MGSPYLPIYPVGIKGYFYSSRMAEKEGQCYLHIVKKMLKIRGVLIPLEGFVE
jgi:hypothetical protein